MNGRKIRSRERDIVDESWKLEEIQQEATRLCRLLRTMIDQGRLRIERRECVLTLIMLVEKYHGFNEKGMLIQLVKLARLFFSESLERPALPNDV